MARLGNIGRNLRQGNFFRTRTVALTRHEARQAALPVAPVEEVNNRDPTPPVAPVEEVNNREPTPPVAPVEEVDAREPAPPSSPASAELENDRSPSPPLLGRRKRSSTPSDDSPSKRRRIASSSPSSFWAESPSAEEEAYLGDDVEEYRPASEVEDDYLDQYAGTIFGLAIIQEESEPASEGTSQPASEVASQPAAEWIEGEENLTWILENMSDPGSASGIDWSFAEEYGTSAPAVGSPAVEPGASERPCGRVSRSRTLLIPV